MIRVTVNSRSATVVAQTPVTSGAVGIPVEYSFSDDWDGVTRMAVFRVAGGDTIYDTMLGSDNKCVIPWELLDDYGKMLFVGAYGETEDGHLVIPTVWAEAGLIEEGAHAGTPSDPDPSPTQWTQIRTLAATAAAQATTAAAQATAANTAVTTALEQTAADRAAAEQAATAAAASQAASGQSATAAAGSASAASTSATEAAGSAAAAYQSEINAAAIAQGEVEAALVHYAKKAVIADVYSPASTYAVGDYCIYEDTLYICVAAITEAEAWTAAHWDAVSVSEMLKEHAEIIGTSPLSTTAQTLTGAINEHETDISGKVSKAGDTMTGALQITRQNSQDPCIWLIDNNSIDTTRSSAVNSNNIYWKDKNGKQYGLVRSRHLTNGRYGMWFAATRKDGNVANGIELYYDQNNNPAVVLAYPAAWRDALGLGSVETGESGANLFTVASGFTLAEATSYRWGKVGVINISITKTTAVTTPTFLTLGTLTASSGMKPITVVPAESTDNAIDNAYVLISGQINCNVTTWAAGTSKRIMAVYLLA